MFIQIRAVKREGFPGVWCAGRFWPSNESLRVEILDEEPPTVPQDLVENGIKVGVRQIFDMTKIGAKSLAEIKEDGRFSLLPDGETDGLVTAAELTAMKDENKAIVARAAALEADLKTVKVASEDMAAHIVAITKERDDATARGVVLLKERDDAQFRVAELEDAAKAAALKSVEPKTVEKGAATA